MSDPRVSAVLRVASGHLSALPLPFSQSKDAVEDAARGWRAVRVRIVGENSWLRIRSFQTTTRTRHTTRRRPRDTSAERSCSQWRLSPSSVYSSLCPGNWPVSVWMDYRVGREIGGPKGSLVLSALKVLRVRKVRKELRGHAVRKDSKERADFKVPLALLVPKEFKVCGDIADSPGCSAHRERRELEVTMAYKGSKESKATREIRATEDFRESRGTREFKGFRESRVQSVRWVALAPPVRKDPPAPKDHRVPSAQPVLLVPPDLRVRRVPSVPKDRKEHQRPRMSK